MADVPRRPFPVLFALLFFIRYPFSMNKKVLFFIFVSVLAGLNFGTVRKTEDPVRDTQTAPILYEQKMEEEKDGKKGPLLYHVKYNPKDTFFIDLPYERDTKPVAAQEKALGAMPGADTTSWWEEQPADQQAAPAAEKSPVPESEATSQPSEKSPVAEKESAESVGSKPDAAKGTAESKGDYWW